MTNLINAEKNMLTILNRKKRVNNQKNKDKIKVANKEERTKLLTLIARENEEEISKEKERPNVLCKTYGILVHISKAKIANLIMVKGMMK